MTINRENIKLVRDHIAGLKPEKFSMSHWCGSACCIAGTAVIVKGDQPNFRDTAEKARKFLGLTHGQADVLFEPPYDTGAYTAGIPGAVRVLDQLLETGTVDWSVAKEAVT